MSENKTWITDSLPQYDVLHPRMDEFLKSLYEQGMETVDIFILFSLLAYEKIQEVKSEYGGITDEMMDALLEKVMPESVHAPEQEKVALREKMLASISPLFNEPITETFKEEV